MLMEPTPEEHVLVKLPRRHDRMGTSVDLVLDVIHSMPAHELVSFASMSKPKATPLWLAAQGTRSCIKRR